MENKGVPSVFYIITGNSRLLVFLGKLFFSYNQLTGEIPEEIYNLKNLCKFGAIR